MIGFLILVGLAVFLLLPIAVIVYFSPKLAEQQRRTEHARQRVLDELGRLGNSNENDQSHR